MENSIPVMVRDVEKSDRDFIFSTWLSEYRKSRRIDDVGNNDYHFGQHKVMEDLVERSHIYVACDPENTDFILGFICGEYWDKCNVVHMMVVRKKTKEFSSYQNMGIGRMLYEHFLDFRPKARAEDRDLPLFYTHATKLVNERSKAELRGSGKLREGGVNMKEGKGWLRDKLKEMGASYNPYLAYLTHKQLGREKPKKYRCPKCGHTSHRSY